MSLSSKKAMEEVVLQKTVRHERYSGSSVSPGSEILYTSKCTGR